MLALPRNLRGEAKSPEKVRAGGRIRGGDFHGILSCLVEGGGDVIRGEREGALERVCACARDLARDLTLALAGEMATFIHHHDDESHHYHYDCHHRHGRGGR